MPRIPFVGYYIYTSTPPTIIDTASSSSRIKGAVDTEVDIEVEVDIEGKERY